MNYLFNSNVIMSDYSGISKVVEKANKIHGCIRLEVGDVDFSPSDEIKENICKAFEKGETHYPGLIGNPRLIDKIIEIEKKENNLDITQDNIYITAGGSFGIYISLMSCINVGDEVVFFEPTWSHFEEMVRIVGGTSVKIPLSEDNNYHLTENVFDNYDISKWKVILFSSPNNPTGTVYNQKDVEILVDFAKNNNILLLCDQEYEAFKYNNKVVTLYDKYEYSITSKSFSKTLSVAGLRLGYIIGSKEWIANAKKCGFYSNMYSSSIVQYGIEQMLDNKDYFVNDMVNTFKKRIKKVNEIFSTKSKIRCTMPEGAVYMWIDCRTYSEDDFYISDYLLNTAKVATVPGQYFGKCGKGFLRISLGCETDKLIKAANRIVEALNRL